ncbi:hypothetical protein GCM10023322_49160 [Rugosimonospora acidiphila]|uniref:Uncharacterized protein n=1 Tax=Rugosimonospora acidiphila TaxID=556531 RepID=A0ABP9S7W9_9ACTN
MQVESGWCTSSGWLTVSGGDPAVSGGPARTPPLTDPPSRSLERYPKEVVTGTTARPRLPSRDTAKTPASTAADVIDSRGGGDCPPRPQRYASGTV